MKIVHLCLCSFYIDNYSYQENMLPKYHVKMGHDVTVIASLVSFDKNGKYCLLDKECTRTDKDGYKVIRTNYKGNNKLTYRINKTLRFYKNTYELLEQEKPDLIFSHGMAYGDIKAVVKYLRKHPDVKVYADNHADLINSGRNFLSKNILHKIIWRYYARMLAPYTIKCFGVTPLRCRFLEDIYKIDKSKIEFLPMGIDDDAIPQNQSEIKERIISALDIPKDSFIIVTGGKIDRLKNIHHLLSVITKLNNSKIHLIVFGNIAPEMQDTLSPYFNHKQIHFVGWCNAKQIMEYMSTGDLYCFPGTHSVLWEQAVGLGKPCIFKEWNGMTHVNISGNSCFVKGDDENELETTIRELIDTDKYVVMFQKAKEVANSFRYSQIAKKSIGVTK